MKTIKKFCALVVCALASLPSMAQQTYQEMEQLTINENVTTVITASEPVRFVDISTDAVVGDQPINNTIRLKPKEGAAVHADGDILAIVTIVTERYRTQYALIYTTRMQEAVTDKQILSSEKIPYHNPSVSMSTEDMTRYLTIPVATYVARREHAGLQETPCCQSFCRCTAQRPDRCGSCRH